MPLTVTIGDELAKQLGPYEAQLPEILKLGIREFKARAHGGYDGISDVLDKLATLPTPEEVLALHPAPAFQERLDALLEKNCVADWSPDDQREWDQYEYVEHMVRLAKASAARKVKDSKSA